MTLILVWRTRLLLRLEDVKRSLENRKRDRYWMGGRERTRDENKGKAHIEIDIYVGCYI